MPIEISDADDLDDLDDSHEDAEQEEDLEQPDEEPRPRRRSARSRTRRRPPRHTVNLKADFSMPIERLARLAEEDYESENETPDLDASSSPSTHVASLPFEPTDGVDGISTDEYLRQVKERNRVKALIYRVPKLFADRNPLIGKKPASAPGWAFQGEIPFDPQTLDSDLLTLFADGHYFIEIRDRGRFKAGFLRTIGNPQPADPVPAAAPAPVVVHESTAPANPLADTKAQVMMMNSVVAAATRLLEAKASAEPPALKPPSLKERIDEMIALQRLLQPPQATAPAPSHDPMERLANALESEAVKKILNVIKSDNPGAPAEPQTSVWDFAAQAAEMLAPGLNPLLGALGTWISGQIANQPAPANRSTAPQRPTGAVPPARAAAPQPLPPQQEDNAVNLEFLLEDLFQQTSVEETAGKVRILASKPFVGRFVKQYLAAPNEQIWADLLNLCESDEERARLQQSLEAATWKEDWLNALKAQLNGGTNG